MRAIVWSRDADRDLRRIEIWLDSIDPDLTDRFVDDLVVSTRRLLDFPLSAPATAITGIRKLSLQRFDYILLYTIEDDRIVIVRMRHGREDWHLR